MGDNFNYSAHQDDDGLRTYSYPRLNNDGELEWVNIVRNFDLESLIGEISTSPTANTVMDRLKQIESIINTLESKDFATQTTLNSINNKDFATEATLSNINSKDFATETTLNNIDFATETTLGEIVKDTQDLNINTDVNASIFDSTEISVSKCEEIAYGLGGTGGFDLILDWTDGAGTSLFQEKISSSDGSNISGTIPVKSNHVQITVDDTSGASNTVTGVLNAH